MCRPKVKAPPPPPPAPVVQAAPPPEPPAEVQADADLDTAQTATLDGKSLSDTPEQLADRNRRRLSRRGQRNQTIFTTARGVQELGALQKPGLFGK